MRMAKGFLLIVFCYLWRDCVSFNVDTKFPLIIQGPKGSHFGYQTQFYLQGQEFVLMVGAPKASFQKFTEIGAIYSCDINSLKCQNLLLEDRASETDKRLRYKKEVDWNYSWIGGTLDVSDTEEPFIAACGHLWKNPEIPDASTGICYVMMDKKEVHRLQPLIGDKHQPIANSSWWYYSYGCNGFSAQFLHNSLDLMMGGPGVHNFSGAVTLIENQQYLLPFEKRKFQFQERISNQLPTESYFGYSLTSGSFTSDKVQLVIGAPRQEDHGKVYIFDKPIPPHELEWNEVIISFAGNQMGEYFGAALCSVDFNNDERSDLLIGSPMFSSISEEGKVYVFRNQRKGGPLNLVQFISGTKRGSRFGSVISAIGDIDQDGYQDIAIAAPFEDVNGAVYIYFGSSESLLFAQKILASDIDQSLRGFGFSISKGKDIDKNEYPDIAVGAYGNDQVLILRSRPIVSITADINYLKINSHHPICSGAITCFNITVDFNYTGYSQSEKLVIQVILQTDADSLKKGLPPPGELFYQNDRIEFINVNVDLKKKPHELFICQVRYFSQPDVVRLNLSYEIADDSELTRKFCSTCPILSLFSPKIVIKEIPIVDCGSDDVCQSDLVLTAELVGLSEKESFSVGSTDALELQIRLTNGGEAALEVLVFISLPEELPIFRISRCEDELFDSRSPSELLICSIGTLRHEQQISLEVSVDVRQINPDWKSLSFKMEAQTESNETDRRNNNRTITVPLKWDGKLTIVGAANVDHNIVYPKISNNVTGEWNVFYNFKLFKYGSSPIQSTKVQITVPVKSKEGQLQFVQISTVESQVKTGSSFSICKLASVKPPSTPSPATNPSAQKDLSIIDCKTTICSTLQFLCEDFNSLQAATIEVHLKVLKKEFVKLIGASDEVKLHISALATIEDIGFEEPTTQTEITTVFVREGRQSSKPLADWILPVSIIAALVILLLIGLVLWKVGFFRRKKKEELKNKITNADSHPEAEEIRLLEIPNQEENVN